MQISVVLVQISPGLANSYRRAFAAPYHKCEKVLLTAPGISCIRAMPDFM